MNILKKYTERIAKVVFTSNTREQDLCDLAPYAFKVPKGLELEYGDYVVMDCIHGLKTGVFIEYSNKRADRNLANKYVLSKIGEVTVFNYRN